jgi:hypothetical protein
MMRGLLVAAAGMAATVVPATAAAENTPNGAATITPAYMPPGPACIAAFFPSVSVAWQVVVGEGGQGGTVRPIYAGVVGDPVELPATPGTYTFPAPHIFGGGACPGLVGIVQTTGSHAIVTREAADRQFLTVARDGQADERIDGARLTTSIIVEPDKDHDLRGDSTEDRTDLRVSAKPAREADGRARVEVTVANAGALAADLPALTTTVAGARWEGACAGIALYPSCPTPRLEAGESRTFVLRGDLPGAVNGDVSISSEGAELAAGDNKAAITLPAAPAFDLVAAEKQRLSEGVKVQVRSVRAGRTRVTVAYKVRGRTVKVGKVVKLAPYTARSVTIKATGAKLRSLRRAAAQGALSAEITARTFSGKTPVSAKVTVTR